MNTELPYSVRTRTWNRARLTENSVVACSSLTGRTAPVLLRETTSIVLTKRYPLLPCMQVIVNLRDMENTGIARVEDRVWTACNSIG